MDSKDLTRLGQWLLETYLKHRKKSRPEKIILDIDSTDDVTHGQQEFSFYHGYYREHMYHPLLLFDRFVVTKCRRRHDECVAPRGRGTRLRVGPRRRTRAVRRGVQGRGYPLAGRAVSVDDCGTAAQPGETIYATTRLEGGGGTASISLSLLLRDATDIASSPLRELDAVALATNVTVFMERGT